VQSTEYRVQSRVQGADSRCEQNYGRSPSERRLAIAQNIRVIGDVRGLFFLSIIFLSFSLFVCLAVS